MTVPDLTDGERDALEEANINFLTCEYKREYIKNGVCCNGEFIDVQMGADYIVRCMREELYEVFLANAKIPYTDAGFALVANAAFRALNKATDLGIIATDPESGSSIRTITIPRRADATEDQMRSRTMPPIRWTAELEGAVHSSKINGTLTVSLNA